MFSSLMSPFAMIGAIAILVTRFGWPGILIVIVMIIIIPFQLLVGKINGKIIEKINASKDKRVKLCT